MKMRLIILCFCSLMVLQLNGQQHPMGLEFSDKDKNVFTQKNTLLAKADYSNLPQAFSMEQYAPTVASQGDMPTCVAFSTAYYMRTMLDAIALNITTKSKIDKLAFSPAYLYEKIRKQDDVACAKGVSLPDGLLALRNFGTTYLEDVNYPRCNFSTAEFDKLAAEHKIREIVFLPFYQVGTPKQRAGNIKKALSEKTPVIFGMAVPPSFHINTLDVWTPSPSETVANVSGNHAMCIIGYDDNKAGGAFQIINSWGEDWGVKGISWIRYADFFKFSIAAFQAYPLPAQPKLTTMKGGVDFRLNSESNMPITLNRLLVKGPIVTDDNKKPNSFKNSEIVTYTMLNDYASQTSYKLYIENNQTSYVYVIGTDLNMSMVKLFPYADNVSTIIGPNSTLVIPSETKSITLDNNPGTEFTLILFSKEPIEFDTWVKKMQNASGNLTERLMETLGSKLIEPKYINYSKSKIGFEINAETSSSIVPILVSFKHI